MSGGYLNAAAVNRAPTKRGGTADPNMIQLIAAGAATEAHNLIKLPRGRNATLKVGASAVRVVFTGEVGAAAQVGATDLLFEANARYDWMVTDADCVVYCEGTAAHESWVWPSSPKV